MGFSHLVPRASRVFQGAGAVLVADLLLGMTAFSSITLGGLWVFSAGWIRLVEEYGAVGRTFGAPWQLDLAWVGFWVCLPAMVGVVYLGYRALHVPVGWFRRARASPT